MFNMEVWRGTTNIVNGLFLKNVCLKVLNYNFLHITYPHKHVSKEIHLGFKRPGQGTGY